MGTATVGDGYEMDAIASVVIGGASMNGGTGSVTKTIVGAMLMGVLYNIMNLMGIASYPQMIVKGVVIILAVLLYKKNKESVSVMIRKELLNAGIEELEEQAGIVANIERYAINDGNGVRTTVFLKGCQLRCRWCSNPETQAFFPEMSFFPDKCIACRKCQKLCPVQALDEQLVADRKLCRDCYKRDQAFACTKQCYTKCRKITGEHMSARQVYEEVRRDVQFYEASGGGVTLSGGEPMAQPDFAYAMLRIFTERWIDTAIETCGFAEKEDYIQTVPT